MGNTRSRKQGASRGGAKGEAISRGGRGSPSVEAVWRGGNASPEM
jgi:hypothetical protein